MDLAFVKRVEVLRGPASSLYGSDAIGGVVAMTTLRPDDVIGAPGEAGLRTATGYTGDDGGWNAAVLGAGTFGGAKVLLGYSIGLATKSRMRPACPRTRATMSASRFSPRSSMPRRRAGR